MKLSLGLSVVSAALVLASGAQAQQVIRAGSTTTANLTASDPTLDDGSHYKCYRVQTQADHLYTVSLESDDFDTFLAVGPGTDCDNLSLANDDAPGAGTNSGLSFMSTGQTWSIRANSLMGEQTGRFTLRVGAGERVVPTRDILPLTLGASTSGLLNHGDWVDTDGSLYDCYSFEMRSEDNISVRMNSPEFDTYLALYRGGQCKGEAIVSDDDSGGDLNAEIVQRLPRGTYSVKANAVGEGVTGPYTLSLTVRR